MIRILIADDHAILRDGIRLILQRGLGDVLCEEAPDAEQLLRKVRESHWDLVILDIKMPGESGIHALPRILEARPTVPVLVLSMHPEDQYGRRVLRAGASGCMTKESAPAEFVHGSPAHFEWAPIHQPRTRRAACEQPSRESGSVSSRIVRSGIGSLRMMGGGRTTGQIADVLCLSATTVSTYRARIIEKLGLKTTAELINFAIRNDLVD